MKRDRSGVMILAVSYLAAVLGVSPARAACNLIPSATQTFRSALGVTDRPFVGPGEFLEVRDGACTGAAPLFATTNPADYAVTIVFTPPAGGPKHVVVLATDCTGIADCSGAVDTECRIAGPTDLAVVVRDGRNRLQFRFPDTDNLADVLDDDADDDRTLSGPIRVAVSPRASGAACGLVTAPCATQSGLTACVDEFYRLDGSCRAIVDDTFGHLTALPPPNRYEEVCTAPPFPAGPCLGTATEVRFTTDTAGNLLVPVDWQGILVRAANVPVPRLLRAGSSIDALSISTGPISIPGQDFVASYTPEGALLPPIFLPQVDPTAQNEVTLFGSADAPHTVLRLARKSPRTHECAGGNEDGRPCTADAQCGGGSCVQATCQGGPAVGQACDDDQFDCPTSECGPALFEFRDRYAAARGPVVIPRFVLTGDQGVCEEGADEGAVCSDTIACDGGASCVDYRIGADDPVPLEGLAGTEDVFAFAVSEPIANDDLNGDGDIADLVLTLRDRTTGGTLAIGEAGAPGRAVVAIRQPPFAFPALGSEGDVVAFLEPEGIQGIPAPDQNADGDAFDTVLRVFRRDSSTAVTDVTGGQPTPIAVDAALAIDGRNVTVSDGLVFFRTPEAAGADYTTTRVSVASGGTEASGSSFEPAMSADGRFVTFASLASDLMVPNDTNSLCQPDGFGEVPGTSPCADVFLHDRDSDGDGVFDEPGATDTERVSITSGGLEGDGWSMHPSISADGERIAFHSRAPNLAGHPFMGHFVRDRVALTTTKVDVSSGGTPASDLSVGFPSLSANGRFVGFISRALNLDGPNGDPNPSGPFFNDPNGYFGIDAYVRDLLWQLTEAASLAPDGVTLSSGTVGAISGNPVPVSDDGRWVAFVAEADNLVPGVAFGQPTYLRDRLTGWTRVVSYDSAANPVTGFWPQLSSDGRQIAFHSYDAVVLPDTNAFCDLSGVGSGATQCLDAYVVQVWDVDLPDLVSVASDGSQGDGASALPALSADGRWVAFWSEATNLLGTGGDTNGKADVFLHDRLTGLTTRMSVPATSGEGDGDSGWPSNYPLGVSGQTAASVSADGRTVAFTSAATNLVDGDTNASADVFVRGPDPADTASERTGDGDLDDTVLEVIDATTGVRTALCPAGQTTVNSGQVAFLRPEASGATTAAALPLCPLGTPVLGGVSLDTDGDAADEVVHFWRGTGTVENLGLAASMIALSPTHVAAVSGTVRVRSLAGGSWIDTGHPATTIGFCGGILAFIRNDYTLGLYDPTLGIPVLTGQRAEEFVCNESQVAFSTSEFAQGENLNGDSDQNDAVLQVYDISRATCLGVAPPSDCLLNSGQAVRPCRLEACDPRVPYRVAQDTVRFLTFECDQGGGVTSVGCPTGGTELSGDTPPDAVDLVIQSFNVRTRITTPIGTVIAGGTQTPLPPDPPVGTGGGEQTVFPSNGRCVEVVGGSCTANGDCANGGFCDASTCKRDQGVCVSTADCPPGSTCTDDPIVAASPDTDADGVPDHLDNCPRDANAAQTDGDEDGVGDACDASCASGGDPGDKVKVKTLGGIGLLSAKLTVPLATYDGEPVTVRLDDADSAPIVEATVATVPPSGTTGKKWLYKTTADGLQKVLLIDLAPRRPGEFKVKVKAKRWFTAAQANGTAEDTTVTVLIGDRCFSGPGTIKLD